VRIVELILDEEEMLSGVQAISIVEYPAIESDFITLSKEQEIKLAEVDKEKRILMGPALIPNKTIFRKKEDDEYYIYFSKDTVRKASELFLTRGNQNKSTLEHSFELQGLSVVESWIVESDEDKSKAYGFDVPEGTWMVSMKVYNDEVWEDYVKEGKVKGFSIEGYFADKVNMSAESEEEMEAQIKLDSIKNVILEALGNKSHKLELNILSDFTLGSMDLKKAVEKLETELKEVSRTVSSMVKNIESDFSKAENAYKEIQKKSKELGISFKDLAGPISIKVFEEAKNNYKKYKNIAKQISKIS
jgi:hypothetical protein